MWSSRFCNYRLLIWITEYYTGTNYRPVKSVAQSSTTGHGTNVIQGLAISMEATAIPALIIVAGILYTNELAGLYGIAIAVTSMLALNWNGCCFRCLWTSNR